jgi:TM2 domain-containing membrane protein YozV/Tfp pilus assembly major pilin PilA
MNRTFAPRFKPEQHAMTQTPYAPPEATQLGVDEKLCSTCNAVIHRKAEICPKCGVRQRRPANKAVLLLLTFFLGGFGIHRFYLGNNVLGILYLLFFWTGIPGLIALIEFIVFVFTSREKIEEDYTAHGSAAVAAVVIAFFMIFIIGILAAIAIPAYTDYLNKSKVSEALSLLIGLKAPAEEYFADQGKFPSTEDLESQGNIMSGKYTANIVSNPEQLYLQATMKDNGSSIAGKTVRLTYNFASESWTCSSGSPNGLDNRYLPRACRSQ